MAVSDIFKKVPVEIPNKSGFDETHEHNFSAKVGTLVPAMVDMLLPNDTISLSVGAEISLPPMATDFYGRVKAHYEAFFVPFRILYGGWQDLITHPVNNPYYPGDALTNIGNRAKYLPSLGIPVEEAGPGSLSDYLGYGFKPNPTVADRGWVQVPNPLRYAAYHRIWSDFYRDSRIQQPAFSKYFPDLSGGQYGPGVDSSVHQGFATLPYWTDDHSSPRILGGANAYGGVFSYQCADKVAAYSLRQRAWGRDYFTNATPLPQAGQPAAVAFGINNNQGSFSIASLRAANSLQMWLERNNVAGYRYGDQIRAHFGVYPSDAALDRPLYLGRQIVDVYNKSIFETGSPSSQQQTSNPFKSIGAKYGAPLGIGKGSLVENFTAKEHGYIFVMFSLVPDALYSDVIERDFWYNKSSDFPFPLLQGVGDQPICLDEMLGYLADTMTSPGNDTNAVLNNLHSIVFGYTQRYANHKFKLDRVSGLLKDGESLESFALQRSFDPAGNINTFTLGSKFIEIPIDYLDQVSAVTGEVSQFGCWAQNSFNYHKISTLSAYSIPTLGDPKNTHTEVIDNGGVRL